MNTFTAITERTVTAEFEDQSLPKVIIESILDMATNAPSAKNRQPWKFVVIRGQKLLELLEFVNKYELKFDMDFTSLENASALILVFNRFKYKEENYSKIDEEMDLISIGSAVQNLVLAAENFNLGTILISDFAKYQKEISEWAQDSDYLTTGLVLGFSSKDGVKKETVDFDSLTRWLE